MADDEDVPVVDSSPLKRTGHVAVFTGRYVILFGGHRERTSMDDYNSRYLPPHELHFYDTIIEKWFVAKTKGTPPPGTSGATALWCKKRLYLVGGYCEGGDDGDDEGYTNAVYELKMDSLTWRRLECHGMKYLPCDKFVGWVHNDKLYTFGGFGLNPKFDASCPEKKINFEEDISNAVDYVRGWNDQLAVFNTETCTWAWPECTGQRPLPRAAHAAAKLGDRVYIFGGRHKGVRMNDMHCLNLTDMSWSGRLPIAEPVPEGRSWHTLTALDDDRLVLYGGFSQDRRPLNDCWLFHASTCCWSTLPSPESRGRLWHAACLAKESEVIVIGGCSDNILDHHITRKYSEDLLELRFAPKSLLRLSLTAVTSYRTELEANWESLPLLLQEMLKAKVREPVKY